MKNTMALCALRKLSFIWAYSEQSEFQLIYLQQ